MMRFYLGLALLAGSCAGHAVITEIRPPGSRSFEADAWRRGPLRTPFRPQARHRTTFSSPKGCGSDVILVLDRAGDSDAAFLRRQVMAAQFPLRLSLDSDNHRLGLVSFSDERDQRILSLLDRPSEAGPLLETILNLSYRPARSFLESALSLAKTLLLDRRPGRSAHVILLSDAAGVTGDAARLGGAVTVEPFVFLHVVALGSKAGLGSLASARDLVLGGPADHSLELLLDRIGRCPRAALKLSLHPSENALQPPPPDPCQTTRAPFTRAPFTRPPFTRPSAPPPTRRPTTPQPTRRTTPTDPTKARPWPSSGPVKPTGVPVSTASTTEYTTPIPTSSSSTSLSRRSSGTTRATTRPTSSPASRSTIPTTSTDTTRSTSSTSTRISRRSTSPMTSTTLAMSTTPDPFPGNPDRRCFLDIMFVVDSSASVEEIFLREQQLAAKLVDRLILGDDFAQMAFIRFSSSERAKVVFRFGQYTEKADLKREILATKFTGGTTNTARALELANEEFGRGARLGLAEAVAIVFTDGYSFSDPVPQAKLLREKGVRIYAVGIVGDYPGRINKGELAAIAGDPNRVFTDETFPQFERRLLDITEDCQLRRALN